MTSLGHVVMKKTQNLKISSHHICGYVLRLCSRTKLNNAYKVANIVSIGKVSLLLSLKFLVAVTSLVVFKNFFVSSHCPLPVFL